MDGLALENDYDDCLRRTSSQLKKNGTAQNTINYGYDAFTRLAGVTNGNDSANYSFLENSTLVGQIDFKHGTDVKMTTVKTYDKLNRLTSIVSTASGTNQLPQSFLYQYNLANQRQRVTLADGSYWLYEYDTLGPMPFRNSYKEPGIFHIRELLFDKSFQAGEANC